MPAKRSNAKPRIAAVILAGGRGERLGGVAKANITIDGVRLIDRLATALAGCATVLIARGQISEDALRPLPYGTILLPPEQELRGPLGGIAAAADWLAASPDPPKFLLSVAVDTPDFPDWFVERALEALNARHGAVTAAFDGHLYPTNALWRLSALANLTDRLERSAPSPGPLALLQEIDAASIDAARYGTRNPFSNINIAADLVAFGAKLPN